METDEVVEKDKQGNEIVGNGIVGSSIRGCGGLLWYTEFVTTLPNGL